MSQKKVVRVWWLLFAAALLAGVVVKEDSKVGRQVHTPARRLHYCAATASVTVLLLIPPCVRKRGTAGPGVTPGGISTFTW